MFEEPRTGFDGQDTHCCDKLWFGAQCHTADIHNVTADPSKGWHIPNQVAGGETQDISHVLQFHWLQPILYLCHEASFPETKEIFMALPTTVEMLSPLNFCYQT